MPPNQVIGESWEITDRPEGVSVIANGPLAGKTLRWLMENHAASCWARSGRERKQFPLLVKILDAQDKLSLQVHPPAAKAKELKGEPKTEMWFIADATPTADLFVGLKRGVTRGDFERKVRAQRKCGSTSRNWPGNSSETDRSSAVARTFNVHPATIHRVLEG